MAAAKQQKNEGEKETTTITKPQTPSKSDAHHQKDLAGTERDGGIFLTLISAIDAMAHAMVDRSPAVWI